MIGGNMRPNPVVSTTATITSDENTSVMDSLRCRLNDNIEGRLTFNVDNVNVDSLYPNFIDTIDFSGYITDDINITRNNIRNVERDKIIEVLKREKNVNTKKCMYVEDLVEEIAKIMHVRL